ncbi:hypothetical protein Tco_0455516 [Tanacetum coccineum]
MAFVSSSNNNTSISNEAINVAHGVTDMCRYFKYHMKKAKMGQKQTREWKEDEKSRLKAYSYSTDQPGPT